MHPDEFSDAAPGSLKTVGTRRGTAHAFDPAPLPPGSLDHGEFTDQLATAATEVGRLAGQIESHGSWAVPLTTNEAIASSRIENVNASPSDVHAVTIGRSDVVDDPRAARLVHNYALALRQGTEIADSGGLFDVEAVCDFHRQLFNGGDLPDPDAGSLRTVQNFIGATRRIEDAKFVPPAPEVVPAHVADLLSYAATPTYLPALVRTALVHYQFETIHPFVDGNGRVGRLLALLQLYREGLVPAPVVPISKQLYRRRRDYFDLLTRVSKHGVWEEWIAFFLDCIAEAAVDARKRVDALSTLRGEYVERFADERSDNLAELAEHLVARPFVDVTTAAETLGVHYNTANRLIDRLEDEGILEEVTGNNRDRFYRSPEAVRAATGRQ